MDLPARDELAALADRVLQLRHRSVRDVEENPNFVVWSLAYIRDLRTREARNEGALDRLMRVPVPVVMNYLHRGGQS